jgi:hypothetical protein
MSLTAFFEGTCFATGRSFPFRYLRRPILEH